MGHDMNLVNWRRDIFECLENHIFRPSLLNADVVHWIQFFERYTQRFSSYLIRLVMINAVGKVWEGLLKATRKSIENEDRVRYFIDPFCKQHKSSYFTLFLYSFKALKG